MGVTLRDYQQKAIDSTISLLQERDELCIYAPPAAGKSILGATLAEYFLYKGMNVAIMVRISALIPQLYSTFKSLGIDAHIIKANEEVVGADNCYIVMEQTIVARKIKKDIDVLIIDEYSQGYSGKNRKLIKQLFNPKKTIGMDGTPWNEKGMFIPHRDAIVETIHTKELVERGYLSDVKFYQIEATNEANELISEEINKRGYISDDRSYELLQEVNRKLIGQVLDKKFDIGSIKDLKTIWFCSSIEHAKETAKILQEFITDTYEIEVEKTLLDSKIAKHSAVATLTSEDSNDKEIIELFKQSKIRHLVSVAKVSIGFDVPDTIVGVDLRPSNSDRNLYQRIGRIRRKTELKQYGIWIDCVGNIQRLGFDTMPHIEPIKENVKELQEREKLLNLLQNVKPDIELRDGLAIEWQELQDSLNREIYQLEDEELVARYEACYNVDELFELIWEINDRYGAKKLYPRTKEWIKTKFVYYYNLYDEYSRQQNIIFKQYKNRFKAIIKERKKITSLWFYVDWLITMSFWRNEFIKLIRDDLSREKYECQECGEILYQPLFYEFDGEYGNCPNCSKIEKQRIVPYESKKLYSYDVDFEYESNEIYDLEDDEKPF